MHSIPLHVKEPPGPVVPRAEGIAAEGQAVLQWAGAAGTVTAGKVSPGGNILATPLTSPPESGPNTPA